MKKAGRLADFKAAVATLCREQWLVPECAAAGQTEGKKIKSGIVKKKDM